MAIGSGLSSQFGIKEETIYGTPVTVDRFLEIESSNILTTLGKVESPVLGSQYLKTGNVSTYVSGAGGDVVLPVMSKGFGKLFKQMFGASASAQVGVTAEYKHTFTPDASGGAGVSATVQLGKPDVGGIVNPFTYEGGKITEWEFELEVGGVLKLTTTWVFENVLTGTALASPSYVTGRAQFLWTNASLTWGGSAICVKEFTLSGKRALDTERFCIGSTNRKEPILNGISEATADATGEFASLAAYNDFVAGTQRAMVLTVTGGTIPTASNPYKLVFTFAAAELVDPGEPEISGPEILEQPLNFRALDNGTDAVVKVEYHTDDTVI
ncbi:MAG TPA: phage tail tube protein [Nitrospira sp.]|jgi:hypothetical protein|nr:phage tail tube protein [Nitrospira sp.]HQW88755.1 phage tail tube protein [Nitrospira sp.]HQZ90466.1 phage tail tube protein [Thermomicrobiales bacterium]HRA32648.1 phage tail tube protein [Thermomicrobiales bacterium]